MGQAMREFETRQESTGEIPALDEQQCEQIMKARPVVLGGRSPNGKAMALLVCRCGLSTTAELVQKVNWDRDIMTLTFTAPEGWYVSVRDVDMGERDATIIRCPEHNFTKTGLHV